LCASRDISKYRNSTSARTRQLKWSYTFQEPRRNMEWIVRKQGISIYRNSTSARTRQLKWSDTFPDPRTNTYCSCLCCFLFLFSNSFCSTGGNFYGSERLIIYYSNVC
jgi:hypothetical protein